MIDLHVHTTHSDGTYTPEDVVWYAKEKGLVAIAVTDHDCVSGVKKAQEVGNKIGVDIISGIEFSVNYETRLFHIVGLMIDIENDLLNKAITKQTQVRERFVERLFERLIASGLKNISFEEYRAMGPPGSMGHFKQYCASANIPTGMDEVEKHIGSDAIVYLFSLVKETLTAAMAIDAIRNAGGIAVWAHPFAHKL